MSDITSDFYQNEQLVMQVSNAAKQLRLNLTELARILGLHCDDVSDSVQLELLLDSSQVIHHQAERFVAMFRCAEKLCEENHQAINNWFRTPIQSLGASPMDAIVGQGRLEEVFALIHASC